MRKIHCERWTLRTLLAPSSLSNVLCYILLQGNLYILLQSYLTLPQGYLYSVAGLSILCCRAICILCYRAIYILCCRAIYILCCRVVYKLQGYIYSAIRLCILCGRAVYTLCCRAIYSIYSVAGISIPCFKGFLYALLQGRLYTLL